MHKWTYYKLLSRLHFNVHTDFPSHSNNSPSVLCFCAFCIWHEPKGVGFNRFQTGPEKKKINKRQASEQAIQRKLFVFDLEEVQSLKAIFWLK